MLTRFILALALVLAPLGASAEPYDGTSNYHSGVQPEQCPEFFPGSLTATNPDRLVTICRINYAIIYDTRCKIPLLTFENLVASEVDGKEPRVDAFRIDPALWKDHASKLSDYANSGYDRGHMVPVGDMSEDSVSQLQTYYLSNIVPQNPNFNRGMWKRLEQYVREIVASRDDRPTYIMTGAVLPYSPGTIGDGVCVPTIMFKTIFTDGGTRTYAMDNRAGQTGDIQSFKTSTTRMLQFMGFEISLPPY
jgi:endonuclease G